MGKTTNINAKIKDNTTGAITPKVLREAFALLNPDKLVDMDIPMEKYQMEGHNPLMKLVVTDGGHSAQMQVMYKTRAVATMEWLASTQEFIFALMDKDTGVAKADFEIKHDGHAYIGGKQIATIENIREFRHTVVLDTADHNKATRAEAITAFKKLPHFDFKQDDQFYIKDTTGNKMISMKYFADGATNEATAGKFYNRAMVACV